MPSKVLVCYMENDSEDTVAVADSFREMSSFVHLTAHALRRAVKMNRPIYIFSKPARLEWVEL